MSPFCKKLLYSATVLMLMLLVVSNAYGEILAVNSAVQASSTFSSSGTIYIPEQPVSPPPVSSPPVSPPPESPPPSSPPPESPQPSGETLDSWYLTGLGDDYCIYYNDGPATIWDQNWVRSRLTTYKVKSVRLGFLFSDCSRGTTDGSIYNATKMKQVLGYLDASGVKGILLLQNNGVSCKNYAGSDAWYNNWIAVANAFKDDDRVAAFSIFGEPEHWIGYYDTWDPSITSTRQLQTRFLQLAKEIHTIDPDRTVIMPYPMAYGSYNVQKYIDDIIAIGALQEPNLIFDMVHPYYVETVSADMGLNPTQKAQWYLNNWIQPCINAFGADRCLSLIHI